MNNGYINVLVILFLISFLFSRFLDICNSEFTRVPVCSPFFMRVIKKESNLIFRFIKLFDSDTPTSQLFTSESKNEILCFEISIDFIILNDSIIDKLESKRIDNLCVK